MPTRLNTKTKSVDLEIDNESLRLNLVASHLRGSVNIRSPKQIKNCWENRHLIMLPLATDKGVIVRVRIGKLLKTEEQEWVSSASARIDLPNGELAICGGGSFMNEKEQDDGFSETVIVKPGEYLATVYSHLTAPAGEDFVATGRSWKGFANYFKTTRPKSKSPGWLWEIAENEDSNLEKVLSEKEISRLENLDEEFEHVQFLVQLTPWKSRTKLSNTDKSGVLQWKARCPDKCPLGIRADVESAENNDNEDSWTDAVIDEVPGDSMLAKQFDPFAAAIGKGDFKTASGFFTDELKTKAAAQLKKLVANALKTIREDLGDDFPEVANVKTLGTPSDWLSNRTTFEQCDAMLDGIELTKIKGDQKLITSDSFCKLMSTGYTILPTTVGVGLTLELVIVTTSNGPRIAKCGVSN